MRGFFSVRSGDVGVQRSGDGDAHDDAGRGVLDRRCLCASGDARPVHLLADALSLRKFAGKRRSYVNCIKQDAGQVHSRTMRKRVSLLRFDALTMVYYYVY